MKGKDKAEVFAVYIPAYGGIGFGVVDNNITISFDMPPEKAKEFRKLLAKKGMSAINFEGPFTVSFAKDVKKKIIKQLGLMLNNIYENQ